jgi:hypothetical protein
MAVVTEVFGSDEVVYLLVAQTLLTNPEQSTPREQLSIPASLMSPAT